MNRFLRYCFTCTMLLLLCFSGTSQDFYFLDAGSGIHKSTAGGSCSNTLLNYCPGGATDVAYYKDTLYAISFGGQLYRGLASKPALPYTLVATFPTSVNSLTVDSTGTVYAAGQQSLLSYKPSTGKVALLGSMPSSFYAGGDLTFYKGKLYLAAIMYDGSGTACLVEVNIQNPGLSAVFMKLKSKNVFGCITLPKSCDENGFYITSQVNNLSSLSEVDMTGKVELSASCTYNDFIFGAASATESGIKNKPQIDSIVQKQACINAQNSGAIRIFAGSSGSLQTYTLNGAATNQTGLFTGLAAGSYAIRITTELGCISDTAVAIFTAATPSFAADAVNPACSNDNGKINVQSLVAGQGLQYSLNKGAYQQAGTFGNLAPGLYTVAAMNESGCAAEKILTLVRPVLDTTGSSIAVQSSTCNVANGSLQAFVPNAVKPLSFSLNGTPSASGSFQGLKPAAYKLSVSDALGCRLDTQVVILTTPVPVIDSVAATAFCAGQGSGSIRVQAKQTGDLFTYTLNSGTPNQTGLFTSLPAGAYVVRVLNQYGCARDTTVGIQSITSPVFSLSSAGPSCKGADGIITIQPSAGNNLYSFNSGQYANLSSFTGLAAGTYGITAKNAAGCTATKSVVLAAAFLNSKDVAIRTTAPGCTGSDGSVEVTVQRLTAPVLFSLDGGTASPNGSFTGLQAAAYKLSLTDGNSCSFDTTLTLVRIFPARPVTEWRKTAPTCPYAADGAVAITVSGSEGPYTVSLNNGPFTATYVYPKLDAGSYAVAIRNNKGCLADSLSVLLAVPSNAVCNVIRFPNAFTPGGDGHNDIFKPVVRGVLEEYVMMVYNRFGQKVFESHDPAKGWNGTAGQAAQSTGAFVWLSRYKFAGQGQERKMEKGTVMVVR